MDSIDRVEKMNEKEALPPIFKKLNSLKKDGHLGQEMCEDLMVMAAGYFLYKAGVENMGARLGVRLGSIGCHRPEEAAG